MSDAANPAAAMTDAFTKFWTDFAARMGPAAMAGFAQPQAQPTGAMPGMPGMMGANPEMMKQMQRAFFDSLSKYADDFMRSPQFLESLKQTMDNALAIRRQVDGWITNALKTMHMPTQQDALTAVERLHGLEKRIIERLEDVAARVEALEGKAGRGKPGNKKPAGRKTAKA